MDFPGEQDLRVERAAIVDTLESLTDEEFDEAPTLCTEWAPRDILAHLMGVDTGALAYVKAKGSVRKGNQLIVEHDRKLSRERMMNRARHWADHPAPLTRTMALFFLGDTAVHHQDILRGLGRTRDIPTASRDAILREGALLGGKRLLTHRVVPADGGRAMGRGQEVHGTSEALGLWLTGRNVGEDELLFEGA